MKDTLKEDIHLSGVEPVNLIRIVGARENNLRNISLDIPRNKLVVITGLSGSGKSSLAFDTLFAEGQRRYLETFSAYARQFMGSLERPDVDRISGLSPVIAIEQKSTNKNPRSTVGTVTEIYDYLRLLYAKASDAFSPSTGKPMVQYTESQILDAILQRYNNQRISILSPIIKARKGHYRELLEGYRRQGYLKMRIDGKVENLEPGMQLDRYKIHDIELIVDLIDIKESSRKRLSDAIALGLKSGKGMIIIANEFGVGSEFFSRNLMCVDSGVSYDLPEPNTFSFNSPYGACPKCKGLGFISEIDMDKVFPDKRMSIKAGGIAPIGEYKNTWIFKQVEVIGKKYGFTLDTAVADISEEALDVILYGTSEVLTLTNEYVGVTSQYNLSFEGVASFLQNQNIDEMPPGLRKWAASFMNKMECPICKGSRLKLESMAFKIDGKTISEVVAMEIDDLQNWLSNLSNKMSTRQQSIARDVLKELSSRVDFLHLVGLDYLTLDRPSRSLSGGEAQRIRLATQIGSKLTGVLYILDEPSIGLHPRDNMKLIDSVKSLRDMGNSILIVEHDEEMMLQSDYIIDMGPGAGSKGGEVVAAGHPSQMKHCHSLTCDYISGKKCIAIPQKRRSGSGKILSVVGASGNNLKSVSIDLPLGTFICVCGVSGSGKSSLINETLYPYLNNYYFRGNMPILPFKKITGTEFIDKVIEIDQSPIGKTPRSNPATYTGVFDEIRKLYAGMTESRMRAYTPGRFSFNVKGGRCETCKGAGLRTIEMNFLPEVYVHCEDCNGRRYNRETLEIRFKGKSISDVLDLTIEQAAEFFVGFPSILRVLKTLMNVGLGYISLGQQSTSLSGGESQRVKLATELTRKDTGNTLYILDEPTTGLHFEDVRVLLKLLNQLVEKGNTVVVIEHNLEVVKTADYVVDMGPGGGRHGGTVVACGTPEYLVLQQNSITGNYLRKKLEI